MIYSHRIFCDSNESRLPESKPNSRIQYISDLHTLKSSNKIVFIPNKNTKLAPILKEKQAILNSLKSNFSFHFPDVHRKKLTMLNLKMVSTENPSNILSHQFTKNTITPKVNERYSMTRLLRDRKPCKSNNQLINYFQDCGQIKEFDEQIFQVLFSICLVFQKVKLEAFEILKTMMIQKRKSNSIKNLVTNELKFNMVFDGANFNKKQTSIIILVNAYRSHLYTSRLLQELTRIANFYIPQIVLVQSKFRSFIQTQKLRKTREAVMLIQLKYRAHYITIRIKAAIAIQTLARGK